MEDYLHIKTKTLSKIGICQDFQISQYCTTFTIRSWSAREKKRRHAFFISSAMRKQLPQSRN